MNKWNVLSPLSVADSRGQMVKAADCPFGWIDASFVGNFQQVDFWNQFFCFRHGLSLIQWWNTRLVGGYQVLQEQGLLLGRNSHQRADDLHGAGVAVLWAVDGRALLVDWGYRCSSGRRLLLGSLTEPCGWVCMGYWRP